MFKSRKPNEDPKQANSGLATGENEAGAEPQPVECSEETARMVQQLQADLEEAVEARKRALADFRNFQRRAGENEQRATHAGMARVVRAILPALDHFDLALKQDPASMSVDNLLGAVNIVQEEFAKSLAAQGVERIEPARGDAFDPHRHEAVMKQPADDVEPHCVVMTMQAGYALGDQVLRPAKVAVAPGSEE